MKILATLFLAAGAALGMTEEEFDKLYKRLDTGAHAG